MVQELKKYFCYIIYKVTKLKRLNVGLITNFKPFLEGRDLDESQHLDQTNQ